MKRDMASLRVRYLGMVKSLIEALMQRQSVLTDVCPVTYGDLPADEHAKRLRALAAVQKRISNTCDGMRALEKQSKHRLGVVAMTGREVSRPIRCAICLLAGKSMTSSVWHVGRTLSHLTEVAGGSDPADLLEIRDAFSSGGVLRPYVRFTWGSLDTIDQIENVSLSEGSFRALLALPPDVECAQREQAKALFTTRVR